MPTQETLRDIIRIFAFGFTFTYIEGETQINQAISEIKFLIKSKLPEKKIVLYNASEGIKNTSAGYNLALTEIEKIVEAL